MIAKNFFLLVINQTEFHTLEASYWADFGVSPGKWQKNSEQQVYG